MRTNSKQFIQAHFPELQKYKVVTTRAYFRREKTSYKDDCWFKFFEHELEDSDYIIFAGAKDRLNQDFQGFKVPTEFIKANLDKLDRTENGWVNIFLHVESFQDVRSTAGLSFRKFAL
jgi:hypothetical protein